MLLIYGILQLCFHFYVLLFQVLDVVSQLHGLTSEPVDALFQKIVSLVLLHAEIEISRLLLVLDQLHLDFEHVVSVSSYEILFVFGQQVVMHSVQVL